MCIERLFLHRFMWMLLPSLIVLGQLGIEIFVPDKYMSALHSEFGPHEALQSLILLFVVILALRVIRLAPTHLLRAWGLLAFLGGFYVFGEELSWGQHVFEWSTPEFWTQINDQGETNLHNTSSWLDQKPRLALEIGAVVCGILLPLMQRFCPKYVPSRFALIYGEVEVIPSAAFFLFIKTTDKIYENFDLHFFWRSSEVEELYLFLFVVIYLAVLCRRFVQIREENSSKTIA